MIETRPGRSHQKNNDATPGRAPAAGCGSGPMAPLPCSLQPRAGTLAVSPTPHHPWPRARTQLWQLPHGTTAAQPATARRNARGVTNAAPPLAARLHPAVAAAPWHHCRAACNRAPERSRCHQRRTTPGRAPAPSCGSCAMAPLPRNLQPRAPIRLWRYRCHATKGCCQNAVHAPFRRICRI